MGKSPSCNAFGKIVPRAIRRPEVTRNDYDGDFIKLDQDGQASNEVMLYMYSSTETSFRGQAQERRVIGTERGAACSLYCGLASNQLGRAL